MQQMHGNELVDRSLQVILQTCADEFSFDLKELGRLFLVLLPNFPLAILGSRYEVFLRAHAREICLRLQKREEVLEEARRAVSPDIDEAWFNAYFLPQPTCAEITAAVLLAAYPDVSSTSSQYESCSPLVRGVVRALLSHLCEFLTEREFEEAFPWAIDLSVPDDPVTQQVLTALRAAGHTLNPMSASGTYMACFMLPKDQTDYPIGKPPGAREGRWVWWSEQPSPN